ncbi:MAG: aminotransferase class IV family protein [Xanthomonadaceae bacterium]|nr:aminotransferase class IV family protein [Xanthomonadaceae bacterium]MDE1886430.1 aminotransferase class IV family protein [Xanthomonadaceae bacterium]
MSEPGQSSAPRLELNGEPAGVDDLRYPLQTNYGHFTVMRVKDGCVRGLDLHLDRLQSATRELFGSELDRERVRGYLRHVLSGATGAWSVRVNVFARTLDRERMDKTVDTDVLIAANPASIPATQPLRVKSFVYARETPRIKHVGTFGLFLHRRLARQAGCDDALFVDAGGRISEGSIWNVGLVDRDGSIVWPDAPQLDGVGMQLLKTGLTNLGASSCVRPVYLSELARFRAAFFTNASTPVRALAAIDDCRFDVGAEIAHRLLAANRSNPPQAI